MESENSSKVENNVSQNELFMQKEPMAKRENYPTFNCHTHIFNFNYVNDKFVKGMISIRYIILFLAALVLAILLLLLLELVFIKWFDLFEVQPYVFYALTGTVIILVALAFLVRRPYITIKISRLKENGMLRGITMLLDRLPMKDDILRRLAYFIKHSFNTETNEVKDQREIFDELTGYYSRNTKFVVLSMDMDYMINGSTGATNNLEDQYRELEEMKMDEIYKDKFFPFIHADARRLGRDHGYINKMREKIEEKLFQGIKLYPALGYFPFDKRLKPVYDLALEYNLPISTHCSVGPVYYRGSLRTLRDEPYFDRQEKKFIHPFTGRELMGKTPKDFTPHFTHPMNYYCLMAEPEKLAAYWNSQLALGEQAYNAGELSKYKNLKICLAHFGGSSEWKKYLNDPWLPDDKKSLAEIFKAWYHPPYGAKDPKVKSYSWHTIIYDMLNLKDADNAGAAYFPNLYSDISYNLSDDCIHPLLKVRLETNRDFAKKVLFGTDFFMVSMKASEREITMKLRGYLGEDHFRQIAKINPLDFLESRFCSRSDLLS